MNTDEEYADHIRSIAKEEIFEQEINDWPEEINQQESESKMETEEEIEGTTSVVQFIGSYFEMTVSVDFSAEEMQDGPIAEENIIEAAANILQVQYGWNIHEAAFQIEVLETY